MSWYGLFRSCGARDSRIPVAKLWFCGAAVLGRLYGQSSLDQGQDLTCLPVSTESDGIKQDFWRLRRHVGAIKTGENHPLSLARHCIESLGVGALACCNAACVAAHSGL